MLTPEDSSSPRGHIGHCGFCTQGHLHVYRCPRCSALVAVCDECELVWDDVAAVHRDPSRSADSSYPLCPRCQSRQEGWQRLDDAAAERATRGQ